MEENTLTGGFGQRVEHLILEERLDCDVMTIALPDEYIENGDFKSLKKEINLDEESIVTKILSRYIGTRP